MENMFAINILLISIIIVLVVEIVGCYEEGG
jgi:hypothetical protein